MSAEFWCVNCGLVRVSRPGDKCRQCQEPERHKETLRQLEQKPRDWRDVWNVSKHKKGQR
jgi:hypothetical protein